MFTRLNRLPDRPTFLGAVMEVAAPLPTIDYIPAEMVPVTTIAAPEPQQPITSTATGFLLSKLTAAIPANDELKQEHATLVSRASELGEAIDRFLETNSEATMAENKRKHVEIRKQGRAQLARLREAEAAFSQAHIDWNAAEATKKSAIADVRISRFAQNSLSRWATDAAISAAAETVAKAQAIAADAVETAGAALRERNRMESVIDEERAQLNLLANEEIRIRARLTGQP